jgi:hypothetical protein
LESDPVQTICLSPTDYVTGDPSLAISYPFASHPSTVVTCTTAGDLKWVSMGLRLPPYASIREVTVWYQISNPNPQTPAKSLISQIRLTEMRTPDNAVVFHDDGTDLTSTVPTAYTSIVGGKLPTPGSSVTLSLRLNFQNTTDTIMLGAVDVVIEGECSLNVRDFGAKGDGATNAQADDTLALQAAFAAIPPSGALICVPPGIYMVSKSLALKSNTYLKGAGPGTVFKRKDSGGDIVFFSETVTDVTVEAISIDINGALPIPPDDDSWACGLVFRTQCSFIRIRDIRVFDSTKTNVCCRCGILVQESDHVWIERNYLADGLRLKAGGVGDKLIIQNNIVEDANDNAITIAMMASPTKTINYTIVGNIVKAARGSSIYIGDDGGEIEVEGLTYQNILVGGNILVGPAGGVMLIVRLANFTARLHIINNILVNTGEFLVNAGERQIYTAGIETTIQTTYGQTGTDFLIAHNTVDGPFTLAGIWVQSLNRVRINHNQVSNASPGDGMRITAVDTATIQGNIIANCERGIYFTADSNNIQVVGNSITGSADQGILLSPMYGQNLSVSAQFIANKVSDNGGTGIEEAGPGPFDTHYIFNDLRNNAGGAFSGINPNATRVGNLGTEDYILRHISGTAPWDPPSLNNGSFQSTPVPVSGAKVGDTVAVAFTEPIPNGAILAAAVTADNTVAVTLLNLTGGSFDLPQGTIRVDVWRH